MKIALITHVSAYFTRTTSPLEPYWRALSVQNHSLIAGFPRDPIDVSSAVTLMVLAISQLASWIGQCASGTAQFCQIENCFWANCACSGKMTWLVWQFALSVPHNRSGLTSGNTDFVVWSQLFKGWIVTICWINQLIFIASLSLAAIGSRSLSG